MLFRSYKGGNIKWRHDIGVRPLAFYDVEIVAHQFDFYNGNQNLFSPDRVPNNVQQKEFFVNAGIATPMSMKRNMLLKFDFTAGKTEYRYYHVEDFKTNDKPDRTYINFISPVISIRRNTFNYTIYPTEGKKELLSFRYVWGKESFNPGTTSSIPYKIKGIKHNDINAKLYIESYINISKYFKLGYLADVNYSNKIGRAHV